MMRLFAVAFCCLVTASPALPGTCAAVEHDPIEAGDLARYLPAFAKVAPDTPIAPAPSPEMRRVFRPAELQSIAHGLSLQLDSAPELCFAWPVEPLDRERSIDAMKAALAVPDARIEIVEASANPVPRGTIVFRREDLVPPALTGSRTPVLWRGNVLYGANRRFAIWARVLVTARLPKVIAAVPLRRGQTVSASQIRIDQVEG
ncbi:MAG TPA: hypothetical protein VJ732_13000, partial [Bryobacteraceae bacterium]|nr:hypothetical protein [Bryobacteraceae bacterium]